MSGSVQVAPFLVRDWMLSKWGERRSPVGPSQNSRADRIVILSTALISDTSDMTDNTYITVATMMVFVTLHAVFSRGSALAPIGWLRREADGQDRVAQGDSVELCVHGQMCLCPNWNQEASMNVSESTTRWVVPTTITEPRLSLPRRKFVQWR